MECGSCCSPDPDSLRSQPKGKGTPTPEYELVVVAVIVLCCTHETMGVLSFGSQCFNFQV